MGFVKWLALDFVPSNCNISPLHRKKAIKAARRESCLIRKIILGWLLPSLIIWIIVGVVIAALSANVALQDRLINWYVPLLSFVGVGVIMWVLFVFAISSELTSRTVAAINREGQICIKCGYNLKSSGSGICPECGVKS